MHKILIRTELPRLRHLGYEVFCPNYQVPNSQHQSAANGWTPDQETSLPQDIFEELSQFDFFNKPISSRIADLLNQYFDTVIVTIDPHWLSEIVRVYNGKLVYRTYGHVLKMSELLINLGTARAILERNNFWYIPHSQESADFELSWLQERMIVAPYCVTDDAIQNNDSWNPCRNEIMISCPNLANSYYYDHYRYLKSHFPQKHFRYYGVQTSPIQDSQIVGTIPYSEVLKSYRECAGFLYTYKSPIVCFLPPIEMMLAGGPVIYFQGSLLDRYFGKHSPGRAKDEAEADKLCQRLIDGDQHLIREIQDAQKRVIARYHPESVWPVFDKVFKDVLSTECQNKGSKFLLDLEDLREMDLSPMDELVLADFKSLRLQPGSKPELPTGRCSSQVATWSKAHPKAAGSKRFLLVDSKKIFHWWGLKEANCQIDYVVSWGHKIPSSPPRLRPIPDPGLPSWKRILQNPLWALSKLQKKIPKLPLRPSKKSYSLKKYSLLKDLKNCHIRALTPRQASTAAEVELQIYGP